MVAKERISRGINPYPANKKSIECFKMFNNCEKQGSLAMKDGKEMAPTEQNPSSQQTQTNDALQFCYHLMRDFQARANRHKRIFKFLRYVSVSLAVVVTGLATLTATLKEYLWVVPVVSGLSALCTTFLSTTNSQERWVRSRGVQQELEAESFLYLQKAGPYASLDEEGPASFLSE
jgi:hypothetical protein